MKQIVEASESDDTFKTGYDYTPGGSGSQITKVQNNESGGKPTGKVSKDNSQN